MPKSKILNKSSHNSVNTSADVSIGFAEPEDVIKHIKVQGARKRATAKHSVLAKYDNALQPCYQAEAKYTHNWACWFSPFLMNQLQWEHSMFQPATSVRPASDVRKVGLRLAAGTFPLKRVDKAGLLSSANLSGWGVTGDPIIKHPKVGTTGVFNPTNYPGHYAVGSAELALAEYHGTDKYSEIVAVSDEPDGRISMKASTNTLDVPGGRQGIQVFWLNDKHTRRERQAKAYNLGRSIARNSDLGISLNAHHHTHNTDGTTTVKHGVVYKDTNHPEPDGTTGALYCDNVDYHLEHDMMELNYTNTSNDAVYIEFIEYEPQLGASGPLEYYDEFVGEVTGNTIEESSYGTLGQNANLFTPAYPSIFSHTTQFNRETVRLNEIQYGEKVRKDLLGATAKDPNKLGQLQTGVQTPSLSPMAMTSVGTVGTSDDVVLKPFSKNPLPYLQNLMKYDQTTAEYSIRPQSTIAASCPGVFCHQTTDEHGGMFALHQLGTQESGQASATGDKVAGSSSWRPVNMMNITATQSANLDNALGFERGQDTNTLVTAVVTNKWVALDGTISDTSTEDKDGVTHNLQPLKTRETGRMCYGHRTENTDARLLLPNYANEWVKLWREDLYDEANKQSNANSRRPFGSALNNSSKTMQAATVFDQVSDDFIEAGARPTGENFSSMYHRKKKTRVLVEPNSMITYQFFADPGIDGESRLLNSDLVKENTVGLFTEPNNSVATTLYNKPGEEFVEKIQNQRAFFDTRSRCCMVFVNGAPCVIDDKHTTKPANVSYNISTLEKVRYAPKFYNKMQRLAHSLEFPESRDDRHIDAEYVNNDGEIHEDRNTREFRRNVSPAKRYKNNQNQAINDADASEEDNGGVSGDLLEGAFNIARAVMNVDQTAMEANMQVDTMVQLAGPLTNIYDEALTSVSRFKRPPPMRAIASSKSHRSEL